MRRLIGALALATGLLILSPTAASEFTSLLAGLL